MPPGARYRLRRLSNITGGTDNDDSSSDEDANEPSSSPLVGRATTLCQAANVNPLFPALQRRFEPLESAMVSHPTFARIIRVFRDAARLRADARGGIDAHAIRTAAPASGAEWAQPAPEGIHRDGVRVLGIFVIGRNGIEGGATELHLTRDGAANEPVFQAVLEPGQGVVVNDRQPGGVYHFTSGVRATAGGRDGTRDVLVLLC
jgi:hypothetical protein